MPFTLQGTKPVSVRDTRSTGFHGNHGGDRFLQEEGWAWGWGVLSPPRWAGGVSEAQTTLTLLVLVASAVCRGS